MAIKYLLLFVMGLFMTVICFASSNESNHYLSPNDLLTIPTAPSNLEVLENSFDFAILIWQDNSTDEDIFIIERHLEGEEYIKYDTVDSNIELYIDYQVNPATQYYYRLVAVNSSGPSDYSNEVVTITEGLPDSKPREPSDLTGTYLLSSGIYLHWKDNSSNEDYFIVMRSEDNITFQFLDSLFYNTTNYTDNLVNHNQEYFYYIFATNEYGTSINTDTISVVVPPKDSIILPTLSIIETSYNSISLTWDTLKDASYRYELIRKTETGDSVLLASLDTNPYIDSVLISGSTYYYTLIATDETENYGRSNEISGQTLPWFTKEHSKHDLIAFYSFTQINSNIVNDISWVEEPANLILSKEEIVDTSINFITLDGSYKLSTNTLPSKIVNLCQQTNELSLECWIKSGESPTPETQTIVSLEFSDSLAFSMNSIQDIQNTNQYYFAVNLNTNTTGITGKPDFITSKSYPVNTLLHLVYTHSLDGIEQWFINGELEVEGFRPPKYNKWPKSVLLSVGNNFNNTQPWTGDLYMISIYNTALSNETVFENYLASPFVKNDYIINPDDIVIIIAPNPASNILEFKLTSSSSNIEFSEIYYYKVVDQYGNIVINEILSGNIQSTVYSIQVDNLTNGVYTLVIYTDHKIIETTRFSVVR